MTRAIDLDALQAASGIQIQLASSVRVRSQAVTSEAVQGFAGIRGAELTVNVQSLRGQQSPGVTVLVEGSANGSEWSEVHSWDFARSGRDSFTADAPDDYLRVVCTPTGGLREAIVSVIAVPEFVDLPASEGSLPSPTDDGDVLTVVEGSWQGAAPDGGSQPSVQAADFLFTERATAGTYTATLPIPAGATIFDVIAFALAAKDIGNNIGWAADTALLTIGDTPQPLGYFNAYDLVFLGTLYDPQTTPASGQFGGNSGVSNINFGNNNSAYGSGTQLNYFGENTQGPGVRYPAADTLTMQVVTTIASPPVTPAGITLVRVMYLPAITPGVPSFA